MTRTVFWRGPLDSCNYDCAYCPFAKRPARRGMLARDRAALARFLSWVAAYDRPIEIMFTPYGEALIWPWYQEALIQLSWLPQVVQVAIQSNGSGALDRLGEANLEKLALWLSWHPSEISAADFVHRVLTLRGRGIRLSVGAVAVPAHLDGVEALRAALPAEVPLWINAQKPGPKPGAAELERWLRLDPDFLMDLRPHKSRGRACVTGETTVSVDGDGTVRRCHFVPEILGNLYQTPLDSMLEPRPCPKLRCDCYIGYSRMPELGLSQRYGRGLLARMRPAASP